MEGLIFGMACMLVNIVGLCTGGLYIPGGGGLYSKVYGILLFNVSYILAESYKYNINAVELHGSGKY
jgi:hypothetical protein